MGQSNLIHQIQICLARFIYNKEQNSESLTIQENDIIDNILKFLLSQHNINIINSLTNKNKYFTHPDYFLKINEEDNNKDRGINKAYLAIRAIRDSEKHYNYDAAKEKYLSVWRIKRPYIMLNSYLESITTDNGKNFQAINFAHGVLVENIQYQIFGKNNAYKSKLIGNEFKIPLIKNNQINFEKLEEANIEIAIKLNKNTYNLREFIAKNYTKLDNLIPVNLIQSLLFVKISNHWDFHIENILVREEDNKINFIIIDYDNFLYQAGLPIIENIINILKNKDIEKFKSIIFKIYNFNFSEENQNKAIKNYREEFKNYHPDKILQDNSIFHNKAYWEALNQSNLICFTQKEENFIQSIFDKLTNEQIETEIIAFADLLKNKMTDIYSSMENFAQENDQIESLALHPKEIKEIKDYFNYIMDNFIEIAKIIG